MRAYETNGQFFASFLRDHHLGDNPRTWIQVGLALVPTGRADDWPEAMREMAVLHLARRLIAAGAVIVGRQGEFDPVAERAVQQLVLDTMVIDYFRVPEVVARLAPAIRSARRTISFTARRSIESLARREMAHCYLCGTTMDFDGTGPTAFTIDHVWPRAYGGDSDEENLLPSCRSCNERKDLTPFWSMYPVQALMAGYQLGDEAMAELPKEMRFAVHSRAATRYAFHNGTSLKEAFLALGRPDVPSVVDASVSVDVFNLAFVAR